MAPDILTVLGILIVTVCLLIFEVVRIDVTAILCMLALGWSGVLTPQETLAGFASNAVIAMMAVMIMGRGIAKTGIMDRFSRAVLAYVGTSRHKTIVLMSLSVGLLSAFIQNIGAAALFLPSILDVSRRGKMPASSLIMPVGFAAILGGTLSMVGSGPLIVINDLLRNSNLEPYGLLDVTPAGVLLLGGGILFFLLFGTYVLPSRKDADAAATDQEAMISAFHLPQTVWHYAIPATSPLIGQTAEQSGVWQRFNLHILGLSRGKSVEYAPWRQTQFEADQQLALLGDDESINRFAAEYQLTFLRKCGKLFRLEDPNESGFAEVIIPPRSELVGQTIRQYAFRRRHAVEPVLLFSKGEPVSGDISDHRVLPGDIFIVFGLWEKIAEIKSGDLVVVTPIAREKKEQSKIGVAALCFLAAIGLTFAGFPLAIVFLSGAMAMVLTKVMTIQEAYQAVQWRAVFLVAGLIPLGAAMQKTGAAVFLAENVMRVVQGQHPIVLLSAVAILATAFTLMMSNVGAIVVLAPLVINMGQIAGVDPRPLALLAAVCVSNAFVLPTHQVNALMMSAGGYRNADYIKGGSGVSLLFIVIAVLVFYSFYL